MNLDEFDEWFKEMAFSVNETDEWYVILNPYVYNGFWGVNHEIPFFRWLGRKIHNKYIYWLGFQIEWVEGIKDW